VGRDELLEEAALLAMLEDARLLLEDKLELEEDELVLLDLGTVIVSLLPPPPPPQAVRQKAMQRFGSRARIFGYCIDSPKITLNSGIIISPDSFVILM
jgi:hypothetical protein